MMNNFRLGRKRVEIPLIEIMSTDRNHRSSLLFHLFSLLPIGEAYSSTENLIVSVLRLGQLAQSVNSKVEPDTLFLHTGRWRQVGAGAKCSDCGRRRASTS